MDMDQYRETFREEAGELLAELESALLDLEDNPEDGDLVARAFRALHTIKGSGGMFGFDAVAQFTHEVESAFDRVRAGQMAVTKQLIDATLKARDVIRAMIDAPDGDDPQTAESAEAVVQALRGLIAGETTPEPRAPAPLPPPGATLPESAGVLRVYRLRFRPGPELLSGGDGPEVLLNDLRALGSCQLIPQVPFGTGGESPNPEQVYAPWDAILTTDRGENAIRDAFIFVEGRCELRVELLDDGQCPPEDSGYKKLGEILVERGDVAPAALEEVLQAQKRIGDLIEEHQLAPSTAVRAAAVEQRVVREVRQQRETAAAQQEAAASIRVAAEKLDSLVDLVGELVIAQARLTQIAGKRVDGELASIAEEIERLSAELRDSTLDIRMLPIGTTFGKFKRLVRDLSAEMGKQIELITEGAETELDKTVIERLGDPLVHLIRNSCDHGIEPPEVRQAAGKPPVGRVRLAAYHSGPNVFLEIEDDGFGLDPAAIHAKAVERGLISADAKLTERELYSLIFLPGFSTAKAVSNVSGRGVGMDVVKRSIDMLRGTVEVDSVRCKGTTIRIKLPLTLAIIEGLLVAVGSDSFVMPLSLVEECVELTSSDLEHAHGRRLHPVRGELVPYLRLRDWFETNGETPAIEQIAIANVDGCRFGLVVDSVIGQHQTVIKTLGKMYRDVEGLSGATILGDGSVALILDVPKLVHSAGGKISIN